MLTKAGQPEILRAAQRDEVFKKQLSETISDIIQSVCGIHFWIKYKEPAKVLCSTLYQMMTTLSNLQTLGEEYIGMVQVNHSGKSLPNKYLQFLMIILNNCGESATINALQKFEKVIKSLPEEHPLQPSARSELVRMSNALRTCIFLFEKFHKAVFYFNGNYYDIGKRLCGIRYVLVRYWIKDRSSLPGFKLLGIVSVIHMTLYVLLTLINYKKISVEKENVSKALNEPVDACDKCSLCLNVRNNTSVTPCGHLFCWSCIIPWLQEQPKCPLCRRVFQPSRVVFLQNYSSTC